MGSFGYALDGEIEKFRLKETFLFLCPSHVISKPTETELDNNLEILKNQQVRNFTHYYSPFYYGTNYKLKQTSTLLIDLFNNPVTP